MPAYVHFLPSHPLTVTGATFIFLTSLITWSICRAASAEEMVRLGKDVEKMVLSRGLRFHLEDRVLVHDNKTVVFD